MAGTPSDMAQLRSIAALLAAHYRFWELVLVVPSEGAEAFTPLLAEIGNLRLLKVRQNTDFYRRRAVAAAEAIGDVVLLASLDESRHLDLPAMIGAAADRGVLAIGQRPAASRRNALLNPALRALGRASGFHVSARHMMTIALPRTLLSQLLARPDPQLSLRFPPRDAGIVIEHVTGVRGGPPRRGLQNLGRRLTLLQRMLMSSAPRMLVYVAFVSAMVALTGFVYALYAVAAWLVLDTLAEGWLTLSLMLSMTAIVLGVALLGMSLGLQQILDRLSPEAMDDVVDETGSSDFFSQVAQDLNVEIETDQDGTPRADHALPGNRSMS
jgi:hypothetical protein